MAESKRKSGSRPGASTRGRRQTPAKGKGARADAGKKLSFFREMLFIRRFEEKTGQLYGKGLIGGFCHLYIGQEAVVVGLRSVLGDGDAMITSYRDHGHMLACGMDAKRVMAELTGRAGGYSKGKGGSMHMFSRARNFFGGHGIVGSQVPIGTGLAFAFKYRETPNVCLTFLGDGAVNQGQVDESINMAALWSLPVVYVIENNRYGIGTAIERVVAPGTRLFRRGETCGVPGEQVDGMDVFAVEKAGGKAVAHARAGKGPYILEMMTYRYRGHSMTDPAKYRSREEVNKVRSERDPIEHVRKLIFAAKLADEAALAAIDREVREMVSKAVDFAQSDPEPDPSELFTDILAEA